MNLLVLCPHFAPDVAPTGEVITSITTELAARGHQLHVVTSLPWYRHHRIEDGWGGKAVREQVTDWGRITRVHPFPTDKTNIPARALAFGGFTALTGIVAAASRPRPDAVLAMSPPLTLGLAGWVTARLRGAPFVFNIQDVFPDVAVELGMIKNPTIIGMASALERFTYLRSDAVTVLSDDLRDNVAAKLRSNRPDRVRVIPNFVDTEHIQPAPRENSYREEFGLAGKTVVMYAGNVGFSQSLDLVLDAATALAHDPDLVFVINGGGAARADLERKASGLRNVRFVDMQPKDRLPEVLAAADIHVVPLRRGLARSSVPSKMYSILAAGRPIVASVDTGTEVAAVVDRADAGIAVPPDDPEAFTKALARLVAEPDEVQRMGRAGRAFVERWASPAAIAEQYEALFDELRGGRARFLGGRKAI
ncbi:MAG: colanic acid biosynthesis glycosyl transferase WcaI [Acidimicrobiaceae bacterium]|jgi:colanic acid biosynthesis glycosyl transferase WcaI